MATLLPMLVERLAKSASKIHPDKLEALSRKLGQGNIYTPERFALVVGNRIRSDLLREMCDAWRDASAISGVDLGNTLLTVATLTRAYAQMRSSLVATRPGTIPTVGPIRRRRISLSLATRATVSFWHRMSSTRYGRFLTLSKKRLLEACISRFSLSPHRRAAAPFMDPTAVRRCYDRSSQTPPSIALT